MEQFGVIIGSVLLLLVSAVAFLIGRQAARNVAKFRDEHHETFLGSVKRP